MIEHRDLVFWMNKIERYDNKLTTKLLDLTDREQISEELLSGLRKFVEAVASYIFKAGENKTFDKQNDETEKALAYCGRDNELRFIKTFRSELNSSDGHDDIEGEHAERLYIKYVVNLFKIKSIFYKRYNILILNDLTKYPLDLDDSFERYYRDILTILQPNDLTIDQSYTTQETHYIRKKKMIYVDNRILYEYTLVNAIDGSNKYDSFLAYSLLDIPSNYAIQTRYIQRSVSSFGISVEYIVIVSYRTAIRNCEINKLAKIVEVEGSYSSKGADYYNLMDYLDINRVSLSEIVRMSDENFNQFLFQVFNNKNTLLSKILVEARGIVNSHKTGRKTLLYLLNRMNNKVLAAQLPKYSELTSVYLDRGVYPFECHPFSSSLINHNPIRRDLFKLFNYKQYQPEILAYNVSRISKENSCIYVSDSNFPGVDTGNLIKKYNHDFDGSQFEYREIKKFGDKLYLVENEEDTVNVLNKLIGYSNKISFPSYRNYVVSRENVLGLIFDDSDKKELLEKVFENGDVFAVYGAAGTGKSYFASYVLKVMGTGLNTVCIANTNTAVENMINKFNDSNAKYLTVKKFISNYHSGSKIDLLIIDECSTISVKDMSRILNKTNPKLILLLGDIAQIQSIDFGNWFILLQSFLDKKYFGTLKNQRRTTSETLEPIWAAVRNREHNITELMEQYQVSKKFDESIFKKKHNDEIILCLNYDGLYGINNLNKILQKNNPNIEHRWKHYIFKVGDPIIFKETSAYRNVLYNNLKGKISFIEETEGWFDFTLEVNCVLNPFEICNTNINFIKIDEDKTIIELRVIKCGNDEYDNDNSNYAIPFQIAYALSIHKAQGLEFDSVKIIIANDLEERITHSIFYTAITRAKKHLTIYWTPETENNIIKSFEVNSSNCDISVLKAKCSKEIFKKEE